MDNYGARISLKEKSINAIRTGMLDYNHVTAVGFWNKIKCSFLAALYKRTSPSAPSISFTIDNEQLARNSKPDSRAESFVLSNELMFAPSPIMIMIRAFGLTVL